MLNHNLEILRLPAFEDNYLWLIAKNGNAWVVDPGDAAVVQAGLTAHHLKLCGILLTHHHADHTGGVPALLAAQPQLPVIAPFADNIKGLPAHAIDTHAFTHFFAHTNADDNSTISLAGTGLSVRFIALPGHTLGHVAYVLEDETCKLKETHLFCGDTLFAAGCGRIFEGTPAQMYASLMTLAALPHKAENDTWVYCAHEYTLANLVFAMAVEPENTAMKARYEACKAMRNAGVATVPFRLSGEFATNPYLRCESVERFAEIRAWKNNFSPPQPNP